MASATKGAVPAAEVGGDPPGAATTSAHHEHAESTAAAGAVSMWTLGHFGLGFGNQLFQYAFLRLLCRRYGMTPQVPPEALWPARRLLDTGEPCATLEPGESAPVWDGAPLPDALLGRTALCDRTMLSHQGWRSFAVHVPPLKEANAAAVAAATAPASMPPTAASSASGAGAGSEVAPPPVLALSGRAVRRLVCQVTGDALVTPPDGYTFGQGPAAADTPSGPGPSAAAVARASKTALTAFDLAGWFQFHTSAYAPHEALIRGWLLPSDIKAAMAPVEAAFRRVAERAAPTTSSDAATHGTAVIGVHCRLGDYVSEDASTDAWCDTGPFFTARMSLYASTVADLRRRLGCASGRAPVFLASNDTTAAMADEAFAAVRAFTARDVLVECSSAERDAVAERLGPCAGFYVDWYLLTQCSVVVTSNSTFSFSACMLTHAACDGSTSASTSGAADAATVPSVTTSAGAAVPRFWRPVPLPVGDAADAADAVVRPERVTMQPFDPWAAYPLLNVSRGPKAKQRGSAAAAGTGAGSGAGAGAGAAATTRDKRRRVDE